MKSLLEKNNFIVDIANNGNDGIKKALTINTDIFINDIKNF
jgi:DNA-binding response OmpR family regulator